MGNKWLNVTLGQAVTLQRGFDLPAQDRKPGKVPIVSSSGIFGYHSEVGVAGPGVVTGRYGTIGQVFLVKEDYWPLNTTLWVKDFHGNDPQFISYLLRLVDFHSCSDKSSVPGVNRNDLHRIPVTLPPLRDQLVIAAVLGALDDKIESNRRTSRTLERLARSIFRAWFVDFEPVKAKMDGGKPKGMNAGTANLFPSGLDESELGPIPKGWRVGSILDQASLLSGGTPRTSEPAYWNGNISWASAKDVSQCGQVFLTSTERKISKRGLDESATKLIDVYSTVVVARGATTGRLVMFGKPIAMNQTCYALRSKFAAHFALYSQLRQIIDSLVQSAHGSVFDTITTSTFESFAVILPTEAILCAFEQIVSPLFMRILSHQHENEKLAALRDYLLPKLLSGEVRVAEAEKLADVGERVAQ